MKRIPRRIFRAGGVIEGDDVSINVTGTVNNTGYLIAHNKLSVTAQEFIQQHRQADIGRETETIDDGYLAITGTRLQPGGFTAGAEIELNVQRLQSISGEFQVLVRDIYLPRSPTFETEFVSRIGLYGFFTILWRRSTIISVLVAVETCLAAT